MTRANPQTLCRLTLAAAASAALALPAAAQVGYGPYAPSPYYGGPTAVDDLTVYAPRQRFPGRSTTTGAPIELVTINRVVPYRDLDLRTPWGADELVRRVQVAARSACRQMDAMHPISAAGDPPCYRTAVNRAMQQVHAAIASANYRYASLGDY